MEEEWFEKWFDSPWYHVLYQERNEDEARAFIDHLLRLIHLEQGSRILDLACGRGRHARYLSRLGYEVTGLDISPSNIRHARGMEDDRLSFFQHDMRKPFRIRYYDLVLNMFTSFGYFDSIREDKAVLRNVFHGLRPGGWFVLDFMNAGKIRQELVPHEIRQVEGTVFDIRRFADKEYIYKEIAFTDGLQPVSYVERVRAYGKEDLVSLLEGEGFLVRDILGDYDGSSYRENRSGRLILVSHKPEKHH